MERWGIHVSNQYMQSLRRYLPCRFGAPLEWRLNILWTYVSVSGGFFKITSPKTTDGANKMAPAAKNETFLTLTALLPIRSLVSTSLSQQDRIHWTARGNQKWQSGICPINYPLPCFGRFWCNILSAQCDKINLLSRATSPSGHRSHPPSLAWSS